MGFVELPPSTLTLGREARFPVDSRVEFSLTPNHCYANASE